MVKKNEIILQETCLKNDCRNGYIAIPGEQIRREKFSGGYGSFLAKVRNLVAEVFLPRGYPYSVSKDYASYQIWDTLQACCSTFSGMLATQAVLQGVGVGRESATPLAAAMTWFTKDGVGMISGIFFAWSKGCFLDSDCKKWRLFADFTNDVALCLELSIAAQIERAIPLLCLSSGLKAIVGVAGGATRAALTHHQATRGNTADVAAKDGSQETLVNLLTMCVGIWLLHTSFVQRNMWVLMAILVGLHLFCNFKAVKSLRLRKFNEERYLIVVNQYLIDESIPCVDDVNLKESVIIGSGLTSTKICGYSITLGGSLQSVDIDSSSLRSIVSSNGASDYLLVPDSQNKTIAVVLKKNAEDSTMLKSYFHAVLFAKFLQKNQNLNLNAALRRLYDQELKSQPTISIHRAFLASVDGMRLVYPIFEKLCMQQEWNLKEHVLHVEQWRAEWDDFLKTE